MVTRLNTVLLTKHILATLMCFVKPALNFRNHSTLVDIVFTHLEEPDADVTNEYYFGLCYKEEKSLMHHLKFKYKDLHGKAIIRGWLNYRHICSDTDTYVQKPNCVYIRAKSATPDVIKYDKMKFNLCICRISVVYASHHFVDIYFEWYIPVHIRNNVNWDVYFYNTYKPPPIAKK